MPYILPGGMWIRVHIHNKPDPNPTQLINSPNFQLLLSPKRKFIASLNLLSHLNFHRALRTLSLNKDEMDAKNKGTK